MIAVADIFLIVLAFAALIAASVTDIARREIPNWLSFSLAVSALAVRGIAALLAARPLYFFHGLIALAFFFALGCCLYYSKALGGGDVKLLAALAAVLATNPAFLSTQEPFLLTFSFNVLLIGFVYGMAFSFFIAIKKKAAFLAQFRKMNKKVKSIRLAFWLAASIALVGAFIFNFLFISLSIVLFILPLLYPFLKAVEVLMIKRVSPSKLAEGDWLVKTVRLKGKLIRPSLHGLTAQELKWLKMRGKRVAIKFGLPFAPVFLIALFSSLSFGNLLWLFFKAVLI